MDVALVGEGPAAEEIDTALGDLDVNVMSVDSDQLDGFDTGVIVATTGDRVFRTADSALDRWIGVEVGGIGGHPIANIDASVTVFGDTCYRCLSHRVAAGETETIDQPSGVRSAVRLAGATAGRRFVQLLAGDPVGDTVTEVPGTQRTLLPVPNCECDPGRDRDVSLEYEPVSLEKAVAAGERAIDDRVGPITQVGERESFPVPYYVAATADTEEFSDHRAAEFAGGADADWNTGFMKALGEGLERYAAGVYRDPGFRQASLEELPNPVEPSRFVTPQEWSGSGSGSRSESRLGSESGSLQASSQIPWVSGIHLESGEPVQLPGEFVHYPPPERRFKPAITTGLGLGSSTVEAALSGLYEVIERDATMIAWYSTFEPLGLEIDDDGFETLCKRARAEGLSVSPVLVTADVDVPVVAVGVSGEDGESTGDSDGEPNWLRFAAGSGAALDPVVAARSALSEALQNWMELRAMGPEQAAEEGGAISYHAEYPPETQDFFAPSGSIPAAGLGTPERTGREELDTLVERVVDAGLDPYLSRITTRDVAALGFEAVRVVAPTAQPLFTGDPFFGARATDVPQSMGFESRHDRAYHPFP